MGHRPFGLVRTGPESLCNLQDMFHGAKGSRLKGHSDMVFLNN